MKEIFKRIYLNIRSSAFTLAEVLIVLGIIGIIAGITIPPLIVNFKEERFKTAAKKSYSMASQAIHQLVSDNGGVWLYDSTNRFSAIDFRNYFKIIKTCSSSPSAPCGVPQVDESEIYKSLLGNPVHTFYFDDGQFITADGMFLMINNDATGDFITVDVNGYWKDPNIMGQDVFMFQIINSELLPMGKVGTAFPASTYCNRSISTQMQGFGCMYNVVAGINY